MAFQNLRFMSSLDTVYLGSLEVGTKISVAKYLLRIS